MHLDGSLHKQLGEAHDATALVRQDAEREKERTAVAECELAELRQQAAAGSMLEKRLEESMQQLLAEREQLAAAHRERDCAQARLSEAEAQHGVLLGRLEGLAKAIDTTEKDAARLSAFLTSATSEGDAAREQLAAASAQLATERDSVVRLQDNIARLETRLKQAKHLELGNARLQVVPDVATSTQVAELLRLACIALRQFVVRRSSTDDVERVHDELERLAEHALQLDRSNSGVAAAEVGEAEQLRAKLARKRVKLWNARQQLAAEPTAALICEATRAAQAAPPHSDHPHRHVIELSNQLARMLDEQARLVAEHSRQHMHAVHTRTHARTQARTRARARTHAFARTRARTHTHTNWHSRLGLHLAESEAIRRIGKTKPSSLVRRLESAAGRAYSSDGDGDWEAAAHAALTDVVDKMEAMERRAERDEAEGGFFSGGISNPAEQGVEGRIGTAFLEDDINGDDVFGFGHEGFGVYGARWRTVLWGPLAYSERC